MVHFPFSFVNNNIKIIGIVIFLSVIFLILKTGTSKGKRKKEREILKQRYSQGEIDLIEYERQMQRIAEQERFYQH
ncbi:MAG: hypothetical protein IPF54_25920 [Draconibacterium sp.]|nr:hypothetical protein [Draconibacterium sp.]